MIPDAQTVKQMGELNNQMNILVFTVFGFIITVLLTYGATLKWYIPARFKQLNEKMENESAAEKVDIERERILPQLVDGMQRLMESQIETARANNAATMARIEQDGRSAAVIDANTKQLTTHTSRLEESSEKLEIVQIKLDKLYDRFAKVFPRDTNITELFDEVIGVLEETKKACVETKKHKTGELPLIPLPSPIEANITVHTVKDEPDKPDELKEAS